MSETTTSPAPTEDVAQKRLDEMDALYEPLLEQLRLLLKMRNDHAAVIILGKNGVDTGELGMVGFNHGNASILAHGIKTNLDRTPSLKVAFAKLCMSNTDKIAATLQKVARALSSDETPQRTPGEMFSNLLDAIKNDGKAAEEKPPVVEVVDVREPIPPSDDDSPLDTAAKNLINTAGKGQQAFVVTVTDRPDGKKETSLAYSGDTETLADALADAFDKDPVLGEATVNAMERHMVQALMKEKAEANNNDAEE